MSIFSYIIVSLLLVAAAMCFILLVERSRRKAIEKARVERIREANRPLSVWICRYCGFMSLMKNQTCSSCDVPRSEEYVYRTIPGREFAAQLRKTVPKPISEPSEKSV
jgi:ribosomal protein L37E